MNPEGIHDLPLNPFPHFRKTASAAQSGIIGNIFVLPMPVQGAPQITLRRIPQNLNRQAASPPHCVAIGNRNTRTYRNPREVGTCGNRKAFKSCRPFDIAEKAIASRNVPKK